MKIVGFTLSAPDNDTTMFDGKKWTTCNGCGYRVDFFTTNPNYRLAATSHDISVTYDGQFVASRRFKEFSESRRHAGVEFRTFKDDRDHFHLVATSVVPFDVIRRKTRFENRCPECGNYESVIGAKPTYLALSDPLADGFFRTDTLFASGNEKHPLIIVGLRTKSDLSLSKLVGLDLAPAYGSGQ